MMDFEAIISATPLKHAVAVLRRVHNEAVFEISEAGLLCRIGDSAHTQITQVSLPSTAWDLFSVGHVRWIGVNLDRMASALSLADMQDDIHLSGAEDALHFTRGMHQRKPTLLDLAKVREVPKLPEVSHSAIISLSGKEFKEIVAGASDVGMTLRIDAPNAYEVRFDAGEDEDGYCGVLDRGHIDRWFGCTCVIFSLDYMRDIAIDMNGSDAVVWRVGTDMPCEITYARDGVEILHVLAHRVESA